jgi:uncharacterized membrane protein YfcA
MPDALTALLLLTAGLLAGVSNSVAGGGTFFTFPAFLAAGLSPIVANASNTVAVWPANAVAAISYRREFTDIPRLIKGSLVIALAGGALGAGLVPYVGNEAFSKLIPLLILFATLLFTFGRRIGAWLYPRTPAGASIHPGALARTFEFMVAVYGGFFGAGLGVMLMAGLLMLGVHDLQKNNALKNLLGAVVNSTAIVVFAASGLVSWPHTLICLSGAAVGGMIGARIARLLSATWLARIVTTVGLLLSAYYFMKYYGHAG